MSPPRWLLRDVVLAIHDEQLSEHGGAAGLRDLGLLDSALNRAPNLNHFGEVKDLFSLAAAYGIGICNNHPFVDGNKRTAWVATMVFLELNGIKVVATEVDAVIFWLSLAAGKETDDDVAEWLRAHAV